MIPGANKIKHLVSKKKLRFMKDGFDLDLAYITPRLIAMGYPSTGTEAYFRNPAQEVRRFIERYHPGHCKVYNLCIEKAYEASVLGLPEHMLEQHGCFDHNPAPLICIQPFCESAKRWLEADPNNVVAVHCKAGKGRTGMMLSALMVYLGEQPTAKASLELFGKKRTKNSKGVTIPSQKRYVGYAVGLLKLNHTPLRTPPLYTITQVVLLNAPEHAFDPKTNFTLELVHQQGPPPQSSRDVLQEKPDYSVEPPQWQSWKVYDHAKMSGGNGTSHPQHASNYVMMCDAGAPTLVAGDIKMVISTPKGKLTQLWWHTGFADFEAAAPGRDSHMRTLTFSKLELDKVCKDKKDKLVSKDFGVQVHFKAIHEIEDPAAVERRRSVLTEEIEVGIASMKLDGADVIIEQADSGDELTDDDDDDDILAVAVEPRQSPSTSVGSSHGRELVAEAVVVGHKKSDGKPRSESGASTPRAPITVEATIVRK